MPLNDVQQDFDRDSYDRASANVSAASVVRRLAGQLEQASFAARTLRVRGGTGAADRAARLDFALSHLASVLSEIEVIGLINALRHTADTSECEHLCEFCGTETGPWSMLTGDLPSDELEGAEPLIHHRWDQYGVTLCKSCHLSVRQARWQSGSQM